VCELRLATDGTVSYVKNGLAFYAHSTPNTQWPLYIGAVVYTQGSLSAPAFYDVQYVAHALYETHSPPPPSPLLPPPPPPPPQQTAGLRADPHLTFAHGARADFRGRHGAIYNFLSAQSLSVNGRISESSFFVHQGPPAYATITVHGTFMTEIYMVARTSKGRLLNVTVSATDMGEWYDFGATLRALSASCTTPLEVPTPYILKRHVINFCDEVGIEVKVHNPVTVILTAPDWRVTVSARAAMPANDYIRGARRRLDLLLHLLTDEERLPTWPHGIVGQSWDGDGLGTDGRTDAYPHVGGAVFTTYAMAEGAIEGDARDYEVQSAFETRFRHSRFGTHGVAARNVSALKLKTCIPAAIGPIGADIVPSRPAAARRCWVAGVCADTLNPFLGLQPFVPPDCLGGLSALIQLGTKLGAGANGTMQQACTRRMASLQAALSGLGVPYTIPAGFMLSATAADVCPETCLAHDVVARCLGRRRRLRKIMQNRKQWRKQVRRVGQRLRSAGMQ